MVKLVQLKCPYCEQPITRVEDDDHKHTLCKDCGYYEESIPQRTEGGIKITYWSGGERHVRCTTESNSIPYGCIHFQLMGEDETRYASIRSKLELEEAEAKILEDEKILMAELHQFEDNVFAIQQLK